MMVDFLRREINNRLRTITISIIHHVFQVNWRIYGAALVFLYKEDLLFFGKQSHPCVSKWTTYLLIIASILGNQLKSLYTYLIFIIFKCACWGGFFWIFGTYEEAYLLIQIFKNVKYPNDMKSWKICKYSSFSQSVCMHILRNGEKKNRYSFTPKTSKEMVG